MVIYAPPIMLMSIEPRMEFVGTHGYLVSWQMMTRCWKFCLQGWEICVCALV